KENFKFELLTSCDVDKLEVFEQYYIDLYEATNINSGYNTAPVAGSTRGMIFTQEHRDKLSKAKLGKKNSKNIIKNNKEYHTKFIQQSVEKNRKPVAQICLTTGEIIKEFYSVREAARQTKSIE